MYKKGFPSSQQAKICSVRYIIYSKKKLILEIFQIPRVEAHFSHERMPPRLLLFFQARIQFEARALRRERLYFIYNISLFLSFALRRAGRRCSCRCIAQRLNQVGDYQSGQQRKKVLLVSAPVENAGAAHRERRNNERASRSRER